MFIKFREEPDVSAPSVYDFHQEIKRAGKLFKILSLPVPLKTILIGKKRAREVKKYSWLHKGGSAVG